MIKFEKVSKQIGSFALQDISFTLPGGYLMGLIGENGAGKTSLLHLILGLYMPDDGDIRISGNSYDDAECEIRNQTGFVLLDQELFLANATLLNNGDLFGRYSLLIIVKNCWIIVDSFHWILAGGGKRYQKEKN